jgi:hypothetical protein
MKKIRQDVIDDKFEYNGKVYHATGYIDWVHDPFSYEDEEGNRNAPTWMIEDFELNFKTANKRFVNEAMSDVLLEVFLNQTEMEE